MDRRGRSVWWGALIVERIGGSIASSRIGGIESDSALQHALISDSVAAVASATHQRLKGWFVPDRVEIGVGLGQLAEPVPHA